MGSHGWFGTALHGVSSRSRPRTVNTPVTCTTFHDGPYRSIADVEFVTAGWVDW